LLTDRVRIDEHWHYRGLRALVVENSQLRLVILPELGGKLWSLVYKPHDREIFWHHPRVEPRPSSYGAAYDDAFSGGWDELFPNDATLTVGGDVYPDHGEWWSLPFSWEITKRTDEEVTVHLWRAGVVTTTRVDRWISLRAGEARLYLRYRIHNEGPRPLDFLWKLHPALAITPSSRIELPPSHVLPAGFFTERLDGQPFAWPQARGADGQPVDMRSVPPPQRQATDFYYATQLQSGWCALTDGESGVGFGLAFDPGVFRSVWVFASYGGWRGLYVTLLEPCTGYPYQLEEAVAQGTATRLEAGEALETEVTAVLYHAHGAIQAIKRDGEIAHE
jgi:hypothetical protein